MLNTNFSEDSSSNRKKQLVKSTIVGLLLTIVVVLTLNALRSSRVPIGRKIAIQSTSICHEDCLKLPTEEQDMCIQLCVKKSLAVIVGNTNDCATCLEVCEFHGGRKQDCQKACVETTACPTATNVKKIRDDISNGHETGEHEFPSMASIQVRDRNGVFQHNCGGTLISTKSVLTAAHCCAGLAAANVRVIIGEHDRTVLDAADEQIMNVDSFRVHPDYNYIESGQPGGPVVYADVCVVELTAEVRLTAQAALATLPKQGERVPVGTVGTVVGWGKTASDEGASDVLLKADVTTMSDATCQAAKPTWAAPAEVLCAWGVGEHCKGDSGGPLFDANDVQIGIVSWGDCNGGEDSPAGFMEVSYYVDWIVPQEKGRSCVSGDSLVWILRGKDSLRELVKLGGVSVGDYVETLNGFERVDWVERKEDDTFWVAMKKITIELTDTTNESVEISLTKEHLLFNEQGALQRADHFSVGDGLDVFVDETTRSGKIVSMSSSVGRPVSVVTASGEFMLANGVRVSSYSHSTLYAKTVHWVSYSLLGLFRGLFGSVDAEILIHQLQIPNMLRPGSLFSAVLL